MGIEENEGGGGGKGRERELGEGEGRENRKWDGRKSKGEFVRDKGQVQYIVERCHWLHVETQIISPS